MRISEIFCCVFERLSANAADVLEEIQADDILSAPYIGSDGGEMKEPTNILEAARARVAELQTEARAALAKKQSLEKKAKLAREAEANDSKFSVPLKGSRVKWSEIFKSEPQRLVADQPETMGEDTRTWLLRNDPSKLPEVSAAPELTLEQQAKLANYDYCDACNRLQAAKTDLVRLEKKVADMRELMRCAEAA